MAAMRRKHFDVSALRKVPFVFCILGLRFGFTGFYNSLNHAFGALQDRRERDPHLLFRTYHQPRLHIQAL